MPARVPNLAVALLLATALLFAIIELGLSAYTVSIATKTVAISSYDPNYAGQGYGGYDEYTVSEPGSPPGAVSFLLFASLWTVLLAVALLALPRLSAAGRHAFWADGAGQPAKWLAPATLAVNAVTMIFWLAGFAALAALFGGGAPVGLAGALLAFAVMLWLVFLALVVFNVLTAFGIVRCDRMDFTPFLGHSRSKMGGGSNAVFEVQDMENATEKSTMPEGNLVPIHDSQAHQSPEH